MGRMENGDFYLGSRVWGYIIPTTENQMDKKTKNEMQAEFMISTCLVMPEPLHK